MFDEIFPDPTEDSIAELNRLKIEVASELRVPVDFGGDASGGGYPDPYCWRGPYDCGISNSISL